VKTKERYVFLVCQECKNRAYTTHKRLKAAYKLEKNKFCKFCRKHTVHKERKLS
jgi:large subunit ribosomal protein L33